MNPKKTITTKSQEELSLLTMYVQDGPTPKDKIRVSLWGDKADKLDASLQPGMAIAIEQGIKDSWQGDPNVNTQTSTNVSVSCYIHISIECLLLNKKKFMI